MSGISRLEKMILGATLAVVVFTGGWFWAKQSAPEPYVITTQQREEEPPSIETQPTDGLLEGEVINVNTADEFDLDRLPGIGPAKAAAILAYREEHGPFTQVEQLLEVSGIGEVTLENMRPYVAVE